MQVLDAPSLQDDFYLNLVDWSSQNVLAVGLGTCVYLWTASNSKVSLYASIYKLDPLQNLICKIAFENGLCLNYEGDK